MAVKDVSLEKINDLTSRYKTGIRIVIILVIAVLLTFLALKIVRGLKRPANANYVPGGGTIPSGWDATAMTDNLFNVIDGTLVSTNTMQEVFGDFNKLNDNQMVAVYNKWLDKKYDQEKKYYLYPYGTLTAAIIDKIGYAAFGQNQKDLAVMNLQRLKLN